MAEKPDIYILKIGGNLLDDDAALEAFCKQLPGLDVPFVLIHGGGKIASSIGKKMGIEPQYHEGRRITNADTLTLVTMVYAGLINKQLVARLQALGVNALGICGADGNCVPATMRSAEPVDYGFVGDVHRDQLMAKPWQHWLLAGFVPVLSPITHNGKGALLNTNADTMAAVVAATLSQMYKVTLIYLFDLPGVMQNPSDRHSLIARIHQAEFVQMKADGTIYSGMLPKLQNCFEALEAGVNSVWIGHPDHLMQMMKNTDGAGTHLTLTA